MNRSRAFTVSSVLFVGLMLGGCAPQSPEGSSEDAADQSDAVKAKQTCGGFAGLACPDGMVCVDDPHDSCDPAHGGADCGGICKKHATPTKQQCKDPSRNYVSTDPNACMAMKFFCSEGEPFFDQCGCGCTIPQGPTCGGKSCGAGEYCCNDSCGTCAPIGALCINQVCDTTNQCLPEDCGPQLGLANYLCPDGVTVAGPTGNCIAQPGGACGWEIASCP